MLSFSLSFTFLKLFIYIYSVVRVLCLVRVLYSVRSPQFIPSPCFIPSPQSVIRSPQSVFYTDRNPFKIRIFLFLSYSFGIETINTFINSLVPSKTIPDSRPKWAKSIPVLRPKRRKNPTELYNEKTNNTKRKPASKGICVDIYFSELVRIIFLECSIFQEQ